MGEERQDGRERDEENDDIVFEIDFKTKTGVWFLMLDKKSFNDSCPKFKPFGAYQRLGRLPDWCFCWYGSAKGYVAECFLIIQFDEITGGINLNIPSIFLHFMCFQLYM